MWFLFAAFAACRPDSMPASTLLSPSDGVVLTSPWIPVEFHVDAEWGAATGHLRVDDKPADDPVAIVRERDGEDGRGTDYLATLDVLSLSPGDHTVAVDLRMPSGDCARAMSHVSVQPRADRVSLHAVDDDGFPTAARVVIHGAHGPVDLAGPDAKAADPHDRDLQVDSVFVIDGEGAVDLDAGTYTFAAARSFRDELDVQTVDVSGPVDLTFTMHRSVDTPLDVTADLHVHTGRSADSYIPDKIRYDSLVAAGLDVAVITDHGKVTDPMVPLSAVVQDLDATRMMPGIEANLSSDESVSNGHFNVFPMATGAAPPFVETDLVPDLYDVYRSNAEVHPSASGTDCLIELNHPRGIQFQTYKSLETGVHALFSAYGFNPGEPVGQGTNAWLLEPTPGTGLTALDVDALEIVNRFSREGYIKVRRDWFSLLNQGYFITGTGNSDSHAAAIERAGFPSNLVRIPHPAPGEDLDALAFIRAIRAGHVTVSDGPIVDLEIVDGSGHSAGPGDVATGTSFVARVHVRAASWVPVRAVRLVVDGETVDEQAIPARTTVTPTPFDETFEWPISVPKDGWVLAEAGDADRDLQRGTIPTETGLWSWIVPEYFPLAFTNPVRIDADADGRVSPAGLPQQ